MLTVPRTSSEATDHWFVVNSQPSREHIAHAHLERQGFCVYLPKVKKIIRHARRIRETARPLFPGYVFVRRNEDLRWRSILGTIGVRSVVRCGETPSTISGDFIGALQLREIDGFVTKPTNPFRIGQIVVVQNPSLDGLIGQIIELRDNERIIVLMKLLNQEVRVNVSPSDIRPQL